MRECGRCYSRFVKRLLLEHNLGALLPAPRRPPFACGLAGGVRGGMVGVWVPGATVARRTQVTVLGRAFPNLLTILLIYALVCAMHYVDETLCYPLTHAWVGRSGILEFSTGRA